MKHRFLFVILSLLLGLGTAMAQTPHWELQGNPGAPGTAYEEWDGLNMKSSLKNQYASYDNFMEFTKNISQYKQFVGDTNAYEVILL
jgi:hypothetical protein